MRRGGKEGVTAAGGAQPEPPCPAGPAPANEAVWGFKTVTPAPPLRMPTPPPPQLTIAGKSERLPQAVAQHSHLQVHLVPEVLWARADSAPDIPGEGVVLDIRAGSEAVQEERGRPVPSGDSGGQDACWDPRPEAQGPSMPTLPAPSRSSGQDGDSGEASLRNHVLDTFVTVTKHFSS